VIDLLRRMANNAGLCVIVVTHDEKIASRAGRIVALNYGRIESDTSARGSGAA
jgi:ABC-type lipoprotein export system ATPase subunit